MNLKEVFSNKNNYNLKFGAGFNMITLGMMILGLIIVAYGFSSMEVTRVYGALIFNVFFFFVIALCGLVFASMQDVIGATWGRSIKRLHESFGSFIPVAGVLMIVFLLCVLFRIGEAHTVYKWILEPEKLAHFYGKNIWLTENFFVIRNIVCIFVITALAYWQISNVTRRDKLFIKGDVDKAEQMARKSEASLRYWNGGVLVAYSLCLSILAFDVLMSLSYTWFSTLWVAWIFALGMQTMFALLLLFMFALKKTSIGAVYSQAQFHDVGKLLYGFTIFFAYLTYSHIITYWYGNIPEETEYFMHRLHAPWIYILMIIPILNFVVPLFALMPKAAKYTWGWTHTLCYLVFFSQWLAMLVVVMPDTIALDADLSSYIPVVEVGAFLLCFGLFLQSIYRFGRRNPMIAVADPLLHKAILRDGHH